ncbi:MAG: proton-conducting transporter membrane subunit [Alistipes indistinctus]
MENIGIIFIALGTALLGKAEGSDPIFYAGMAGALLHTLNHSFFKSLLFMGAGNIYAATHTTSLDDLGGLGKRMPVTAILFLVGTLAICALPPLSGFVSEFLIYMGLLDGIAANGPVTVIALSGLIFLALIGGLAVLAFTKLYGVVFSGLPRSEVAERARRFPVRCSRRWRCRWRVSCWWGWRPCSRCGGSSGSWPGLPMFREPLRSLFRRTYWTARCLFQTASCRLLTGSGCWWEFPSYCGCCARGSCAVVQKLFAHMELRLYGGDLPDAVYRRIVQRGTGPYLGTDDYQPARSRTDRRRRDFSTEHHFDVRHKDTLDSLFARWWSYLLRRMNARLVMFRTGKVNHYVLYALLFLALVFLLSILNLL